MSDTTIQYLGNKSEQISHRISASRHSRVFISLVLVSPNCAVLEAKATKLRARDSIDFPMLNLAVRVDFAGQVVEDVRMAASAMGSYPRNLGKLTEIAGGQEVP